MDISRSAENDKAVVSLEEIPDYSGEPYIVLNNNKPDFSESDLTETPFETYSELDGLGRCGAAYANICEEIMPTEERESIGQVKPSGWHTVKYDNVDGKYLYNRCHLIGYQLAGENANEKNLITGTRYMNVEGMLPFENMVADYVKETRNHVLYRVTPVFEEENLVASGVQMEAMSVEDQGEGILFHVYVYNVQPGIAIDYATGESSLAGEVHMQTEAQGEIRGNSRSKIYHCPGQAAYDEMEDSKYLVIFQSEQEAIEAGYRKAKR
ncbi:DNA/RNA non-specific endonuclease [Marvinbryantia formatexigens DSM 14469]|nr:DNA/RNA non-specific endonuclease [Marvinbryantia formatexigens]UWO27016.1 DNA/RNA non-specific endonuclease [Marvinbryantia formatexigens DSM 14469]